MAEKVTVMRLQVDLQCHSCYKQVKKILCKIRQIRDQEYDEKQNLVTVTVVCCSPEKIRDRLYRKGGGVIQCIKIVEPPKPEPPPPTPPPPKPDEKPPSTEKPKPCPHPPIPVVICCVLCSEGRGGGPCCCRDRRPVPPPPCSGHGCGCGCGCGKGCRYSHCDYFSEENTAECTIT